MKSTIFNDQFDQDRRDSFDEAIKSITKIKAKLAFIDEDNLPEFFFDQSNIHAENDFITAPISTASVYFAMYAPEFLQENKQLLSDIQELLARCNQNTKGRSAQDRLNTYQSLMDNVNQLLQNYRAAEPLAAEVDLDVATVDEWLKKEEVKSKDVKAAIDEATKTMDDYEARQKVKKTGLAPVVASVASPGDQVSLVAPTPPAAPTSDVRKGVNTSAIVIGVLLVLGGVAAAVASIFTLGTPLLIAGCAGAAVGAISSGAGIYAKVNEVPRAPLHSALPSVAVTVVEDDGKAPERIQSKSALDLINSNKNVDGPKL